MADVDRLRRALRKARQAGNKEDVQKLEGALREYESNQQQQEQAPAQQPAPQQRQQRPQQRPQQPQQNPSWLERAGGTVADTATSAYQGLVDAIQGPEGVPDLPSFEARAPSGNVPRPQEDDPGLQPLAEWYKGSQERTQGVNNQLMAALGFASTDDPRAQADIMQEHYPGMEVAPVKADGKEYYVAGYENPKTGEKSLGYLNQPGLDQRDVAQFIGRTAQFAPAARLASGARSIFGRVGIGGGGSGATQYGAEKLSQASGSEQPTDWGTVGTAGVAGGAFEGMAPLAQGVWRRIFSNKDYVDRSGNLTGAGKDAARKAGLNPDELTEGASTEFARLARDYGDPETAARAARLQEHGILGTRGQVSRDYGQRNLEERMRRGLEGEDAQRILRDFDKRQLESMQDAATRTQGRVAGRDPRLPEEAAEEFEQGLRSEAQRRKDAIDEAYTEYRGLNPDEQGFVGQSVQGLDDRLTNALVTYPTRNEKLMPATTEALSDLRGNIAKASEDGITLSELDTQRKYINNLVDSSANPTDRKGVLALKREFDNWIDESIDEGLFKGDPRIVDQLKEARSLRREYGKAFEADDKNDEAGKIIERIMDKAGTPQEAVNYLFGQAGLGRKTGAAGAVKRLKDTLGEESEPWAALKETGVTRFTRGKNGGVLSPKKIKKAWEEAKTQNPELVNSLYDETDRSVIDNFISAMDSVDLEPTNPSQTSFALENALRTVIQRIGQREAFTKGNVGRATILRFLARMPVNPMGMSSWARERAAKGATSAVPSQPRSAPGAAAMGTAGSVMFPPGSNNGGNQRNGP